MEADSDNQPSMPREEEVETLAAGAVGWMIGAARSAGDGLTWVSTVTGDEADQTLYSGGAGDHARVLVNRGLQPEHLDAIEAFVSDTNVPDTGRAGADALLRAPRSRSSRHGPQTNTAVRFRDLFDRDLLKVRQQPANDVVTPSLNDRS
jgi:hypothetical protein